jgi:hypothetical protein
VLAPFAPFEGVPLLDDTTPYVGPPLPSSLDEVRMTDELRQWLTTAEPELAALIEAQGMAVLSGENVGFRFFHDAYKSAAYGYGTVFVTADTGYHTWHQVFDKVLRDVEQERLLPALGALLVDLVDAARVQEQQLSTTPLADTASRVVAYYEAAATLLGEDVAPVSDLAEQAIALATDATELTSSPITAVKPCEWPEAFVGCVDYTQFLPRGHYTRTAELERFFRAMSLLGQEAFYVDDADSLRIGLLASGLIAGDPDRLDAWRDIYEPTAFLVGVADDYTPEEAQAAASAEGVDLADPVSLADDATVLAVGQQLLAARPVSIDPENASVRVMGARLTLDGYVLDQLAWPNVGTETERRVFVSPLDLASSFGSTFAAEVQQASGESDFANYDEQMAALRALIDERQTSDWAGTVYDAWLYALEPQFVPRSTAYPEVMRSDAWAAKSHQAGFGSYTELKHDTLLYAKQGTAAEGEGPMPPPYVPYHTVEQDPVAFGRVAAVARLCQEGLAARGLLTDVASELLDTVIELNTWWAGIARDELAGVTTSDADLERLAAIGSELELLWYETSELEPDYLIIPDPDEASALVADIFRSSFEILPAGHRSGGAHLRDGPRPGRPVPTGPGRVVRLLRVLAVGRCLPPHRPGVASHRAGLRGAAASGVAGLHPRGSRRGYRAPGGAGRRVTGRCPSGDRRRFRFREQHRFG